MDSPTGIGAMIFEAVGSGNLAKLMDFNARVGDITNYRRICDVYSDSSTGRRVLNHAAEMGFLQICQFLVETIGVQIDVVTYKGDTPMIGAAKESHVEIVKYLISQEALLQVGNFKGFTSLHYAVLNGNLELIELLVSKGALLEADSVDGTPLHCAASRGNIEALKFLLENDAEADSVNLFCGTPLICAIKSDSFECVDLLITYGADPDEFSYGLTPLAHAAKNSDTRYLTTLLGAGAQPDECSTGFVKPIVEAALVNNLDGVRILYPLTEQIPHCPNWSVDGIIAYAHSEEANTMRMERLRWYMESLEKSGKEALETKDYCKAIECYSEASYLDPANSKWIQFRSMCSAREGSAVDALRDAEECLRLNSHRPRQIEPHYRGLQREGDVEKLFRKFHLASLQYILDPKEEENVDAFRAAVFEYLSWLYIMSCPEEKANYNQHFL